MNGEQLAIFIHNEVVDRERRRVIVEFARSTAVDEDRVWEEYIDIKNLKPMDGVVVLEDFPSI